MIARELGLDEKARQTIAVAALLHDVGKIGVPDAVLRKPGLLSEAEFAAIKQHPTMGATMVAAVPGLEETLDAVRHHHERWDGGGYPAGLCGEAVPLMARLMAVADAYSGHDHRPPVSAGDGVAEGPGAAGGGGGDAVGSGVRARVFAVPGLVRGAARVRRRPGGARCAARGPGGRAGPAGT